MKNPFKPYRRFLAVWATFAAVTLLLGWILVPGIAESIVIYALAAILALFVGLMFTEDKR